MYTKYITLIFKILLLIPLASQANPYQNDLNVISYHLTIEPEINQGYISGSVVICFQINETNESVVLNSGNLVIDNVIGNNVLDFKKTGNDLIINLSEREQKDNEITISYHGSPKRGIFFDKENGEAYTAYATNQWMICNDLPRDKALFNIDLVIPSDKSCVASGELRSKIRQNNKIRYSYQQNYETPAYTYGFAIGNYNKVKSEYKGVVLNYLAPNYSSNQLKVIFKETPSIISFFEQKSGIEYYQSVYSQILIGNHYQEMSGYSILKDGYGNLVLKDSTETNLISHELSHQWWGNRITCKNWNHFWLNEAIATFMSAAYNEHRFGKEKYESDIGSYFKVYQGLKKRGKDKPLVFNGWSNPTRDDRNIVYFKGAYVIHLLREEMGEEKFWNALRFYSTKYFGKTVTTLNFQLALEESSEMNLKDFFSKWVYK
ncbi:M1 family aminopeptidase [uncultured Maribacter sp.]|uniref:M1 family aminopeptidase n=1 Tax=uncultured Maribacter sp. TaxID=431308 RepID=UPI002603988D|nr:M1 family aminopeptidase [uncultured Maribacter sp.]